MKNLLAIIFMSLIAISAAMADETAAESMQRAAGKVNCNHIIRVCSYVAQNIKAKDLQTRLEINLFQSAISPNEGFINAIGIKEINFYFYPKKDEEGNAVLDKVITAIPFFDRLEDFDGSDLVLLTTEIFSMSEGGFSNLQASATTKNDAASTIADYVITSAFGATGAALEVGTNLLSSLLGSNKIREESSKIMTVSQLIPNLESISYSNTTTIPIVPAGSLTYKEETAGLTISGSVSISARDSQRVLIKDFGINYGVVEATATNDRVNILRVSNPQLTLIKGTSSVLVSSITMSKGTTTEYSAVAFGRKKEKMLNKLMIVTRAEAISFQDYVDELLTLRNQDLYGKFSTKEISKFPISDISMKELLGHVKPYAYFLTDGTRKIGFKLDVEDARLNNYDKSILVDVKKESLFSPGLQEKIHQYYRVQNLMKTGVSFGNLSDKALKKALVKIKVTLKVKDSDEETSRTLEYNPLTNEFFE